MYFVQSCRAGVYQSCDGCKVLNNMLDCTSTSVIRTHADRIKNVEIRYNYMAQTGDLYNNDGFENKQIPKVESLLILKEAASKCNHIRQLFLGLLLRGARHILKSLLILRFTTTNLYKALAAQSISLIPSATP